MDLVGHASLAAGLLERLRQAHGRSDEFELILDAGHIHHERLDLCAEIVQHVIDAGRGLGLDDHIDRDGADVAERREHR